MQLNAYKWDEVSIKIIYPNRKVWNMLTLQNYVSGNGSLHIAVMENSGK